MIEFSLMFIPSQMSFVHIPYYPLPRLPLWFCLLLFDVLVLSFHPSLIFSPSFLPLHLGLGHGHVSQSSHCSQGQLGWEWDSTHIGSTFHAPPSHFANFAQFWGPHNVNTNWHVMSKHPLFLLSPVEKGPRRKQSPKWAHLAPASNPHQGRRAIEK